MEKKVKKIIALNNITLESTEGATQTAASRVVVDSYLSDKLNLTCEYTTGSTETNNNCYIKVWGYVGDVVDGTNHPFNSGSSSGIAADTDGWMQLGTYASSGSEEIFSAKTYKIKGAAASTVYKAHFNFGITFPKIRVSAYEDGVAANKGKLKAIILLQ